MKSTRLNQIAGPWLVAALIAANSFTAAAQSTNAPIDMSAVRTIADRNIFDPNRTPRLTYTRRAAPPRQPDSFSFVGTMSYDKGDFAFFDGTSAEFHKTARVDDSIGLFKVAAIDPDSVTLTTETNEIVLQLGDQVRDDGAGHWVPAPNNAAPSSRGGNSTGRAGRFSFRRNGNTRGGSNRGDSNRGDANGGNRRNNNAATPPIVITAQPNEENTPPADENAMPDNVIIVPVDVSGQDTLTEPQTEPATTATP